MPGLFLQAAPYPGRLDFPVALSFRFLVVKAGLIWVEFDDGPWQALLVEVLHEGVGIVLFHIPDAGFGPVA